MAAQGAGLVTHPRRLRGTRRPTLDNRATFVAVTVAATSAGDATRRRVASHAALIRCPTTTKCAKAAYSAAAVPWVPGLFEYFADGLQHTTSLTKRKQGTRVIQGRGRSRRRANRKAGG